MVQLNSLTWSTSLELHQFCRLIRANRTLSPTLVEITMIEKECYMCKQTKPVSDFYLRRQRKSDPYGSYCKKCACESVRLGMKSVKKKLVSMAGGRCSACGYDKCMSALEFHHIDPSQKDVELSQVTRITDKILTELSKCVILCSNCHREHHSPD